MGELLDAAGRADQFAPSQAIFAVDQRWAESQMARIVRSHQVAASRFRCILFDWGGTLMSEEGPEDISMGLWPEVRAIDGAGETLSALAPRHRIAVATNATVSRRDMIERALARVSLLEYITDIFCFTEIGARKDSPEFWSRVFSSLQLGPADVAMVGDTLDQDVIAPRKYGVFSVWFNESRRSHSDAQGFPTIYRLPDVVPLVTHEL